MRLPRPFHTLRQDRRGSTLAMMAVGMIPMVCAVGGAIDIGRLYIAQSQMQAGVDAAALAGANAFDNTDTTAADGRFQQVVAYYRDNFADNYMGVLAAPGKTPVGGTRTLMQPLFTAPQGVSRTEVTASGVLPMTFLSLFGVADKPVTATAYAEFQPRPLEVMVVLDNTGSMRDNVKGTSTQKITALKAAMRGFVNVLYQGAGADTAMPNLALGIINYTNQVNVGSLLAQAKPAIPVETVGGFTDRTWPGDPMGWKGCVANDDTVTNMSSDASVVEANAYDVSNVLPGETVPGSSAPMRAIRPLVMPPVWIPWDRGADRTDADSNFYRSASDESNNSYTGPAFGTVFYPTRADAIASIANTDAFRRYYYRYFIALNNGTGPDGQGGQKQDDDVIVRTDGGYYNPSAAGAFSWRTNSGTDFTVRVNKIPNRVLNAYRSTGTYRHTSNYTNLPSPNWQCPEPGLPIAYNVRRKVYDDFINNDVWAVWPANGTMHHTGLLWGWRILSRYDRWERARPQGSAPPIRALVFMTDGETALSGATNANDRIYTAYGSVEDQTITTGTGPGNVATAADLRFSKTCARMNGYTFADSQRSVQTYVVAINTDTGLDDDSEKRLKACGKDGWYLTTTPSDLNAAFAQIARALVDVHLTK